MVLEKGASVLDAGSTSKEETGSWRTLTPKINYEKCIRCDVCWTYCPEPAIEKIDGSDKPVPYKQLAKKEIPHINYSYCKGCGICVNECPVKAIDFERVVK
ncbi:MAG: 4Fe-4S binding protein [Thermoplasmata archaeon]